MRLWNFQFRPDLLLAVIAFSVIAISGNTWAQPAALSPLERAFEAASKVARSGSQDIALDGQAVLKLPESYAFIPQPEAGQLLGAMGNPGSHSHLKGLIFPKGPDPRWFVSVRFEKSGYIKDDDAKDWNADDLLKRYREGTEAANKERAKMGIPGLEILGWAERPAYDAATHRLVWAMSSRSIGTPVSEPQGVNYNTYALGSEGFFSLNLVTQLSDLPRDKPQAAKLLAALNFVEGKRYADFNPATDKVAEYGLAALVAGVTAKKLGFFALIAAFFAKFAKLIIFALLAVVGVLAKLFGGRGKA
jgi:uncharacterized membrane-anchored protein